MKSMKTFKNILLFVLVLFVINSSMLKAEKFKPWFEAKGSYQIVFDTNIDDELGFQINRGRLGLACSFVENVYFEIVLEGKYTQDAEGVKLKKAFLSWSFLKNHRLEVGGIFTTFTRGLSGTEFAFINYDITAYNNPDPYQYGLSYIGKFFNDFLIVYFSVSNGEGLEAENVGKGLLYMLRTEFQFIGKRDITDGRVKNTMKPSMTFSIGAALDNKSETPDLGLSYQYFNSYHLVTDLTFKIGCLSFYLQGNYNNYEKKEDGSYWGGPSGNLAKAYGGYIQAGYNFRKILGIELEPMFKYELWRDVVNAGYGNENTDKTQFAIALNWYIKEHYLKITAEYRHVTKDEHEWNIKPPDDNYLGVMITHKFTTDFDTKPSATLKKADE